MPADVTINDEILAAENAFIAEQVSKGTPAVETPAAPKGEQETPPPAPDDPPAPAESATAGGDATETAGDTPKDADGDAVETPATDDDEVTITDEAFASALAAEKVSVDLDAIPKEARPIVQKKLKDLEAGFTRTMQKVRADQKEAMAVKAEARFQQERPADYVVTLLMANPDLMAQVNAKLDEFEASPIAREAHAVIVEREREKARTAEQATLDRADADIKRQHDIVRMGKAAARAAGVPWEAGVEADIAAHLALGQELTEADIRTIAAEKAKVWKRVLREQGRIKQQTYVEAKVKDRKLAGLTVPPSAGAAPAPAARPAPTNDDDFIAQFAQKLGG